MRSQRIVPSSTSEVAVIFTDYHLAEISQAEWKVSARADRISDEAAAISGYDAKAWEGAPGIRQVLTEFAAMCPEGKTVVAAGQNVRMDVIFLERAYKKCDLPRTPDCSYTAFTAMFSSSQRIIIRRI